MSALSITSETNNKYQLWKKISQKESKLTPPISCLKHHWHSIRNQTYTTCLRETIGTGTKKKENLQKSVVQSETKLTQVNCQKPLPIRSKININQLFEKTSHQANRLQQFRLIWNKGTWTEPQPSIQHSTNIFTPPINNKKYQMNIPFFYLLEVDLVPTACCLWPPPKPRKSTELLLGI